ncbi:MAG TPA: MBG domain-containing protein [Vicinamibacterales bacterium]|jgi:hypothetical protein|nr:MBG domain-containing protein [Vicinamibacterales bacterium]
MRRLRQFIYSSVFVTFVVMLSASPAFASHYRGGTISWVPTGAPGQVEFRIKWAQRYSAGVVTTLPLEFGDGQSGNANGTVTSVNDAEDWYIADLTVRHTYAGPGPYTATFIGCCRISTLSNGRDENLLLTTIVRPTSGNSSPVSGLPAIVSVARGTSTGFLVPASDVDRDTLRFRLATEAESGAIQPPGLSINAQTGQVSWNTQSLAIGSLWTTQIIIEDLDAAGQPKSKIPIDVILKIVQTSGVPPALTLTPSGPISVRPGTPVSFVVTATDADPNARVSIGSSGVPAGAIMTPALGNLLAPPVTSTFTWTPTPAQSGSFQVTFTATDDTFLQTLRSITVFVEANQPPVFGSCPAPVTTSATGPAGRFVQLDSVVSDANGDPLTLELIVDGTTHQTQHVAGSSSPTPASLAETFAIGTHAVVLRVVDDKNAAATCQTSVRVTKADQTISFDAIPALTYGSPAVDLFATASSELPVGFSVLSGPAQLSGSTLTVTGAGTVVVRASQAGDDTYTAAPDVDQSFTVARAALTVAADDGARQYGSANPTFGGHITGPVNADVIAATYSTAADASSPVGIYAIVPAVSPTPQLANYDVRLISGALNVTAAPLTVSSNDATRAYGAANPLFTGTVNGVLNGDAIGASYGTTADGSSPVGSYVIVPTLQDAGGKLANYAVTLVNGTLTVTRAALTVRANDATRLYGDENPELTGTVTGLVNADPVTATYSTPAGRSSAAGRYAITATLDDAGGRLGNYEVTAIDGTLVVNRRSLVVQALDASKVYGAALPPFYARFDGLVPGESSAVLGGALAFTTDATVASAVGSYRIAPSGVASPNYDITFADGHLTIARAALTVTANTASKVYGAPVPAFTASYDGLVAGDTSSALAGVLTFGTTATADSSVGTYEVTPGGVTSGNYVITFRPGVLTVTYNVCTAYDVTKAARLGSTLPIKLRLCSATGGNASSPSVTVTATSLSRVSSNASESVEDSGNANPDGNFRFTSLEGGAGYIFNLSTKGLTQGTYQVTLDVSGDPAPHTVQFQTR